jgi:hypothetical protein
MACCSSWGICAVIDRCDPGTDDVLLRGHGRSGRAVHPGVAELGAEDGADRGNEDGSEDRRAEHAAELIAGRLQSPGASAS